MDILFIWLSERYNTGIRPAALAEKSYLVFNTFYGNTKRYTAGSFN